MDLRLQSGQQVTLASLQKGQTLIVRYVTRGCGAQGRLLSLGLRKGALVEVLRRSRMSGPLIVKVNDSQVAIGRCLAEAIVGELLSK